MMKSQKKGRSVVCALIMRMKLVSSKNRKQNKIKQTNKKKPVCWNEMDRKGLVGEEVIRQLEPNSLR